MSDHPKVDPLHSQEPEEEDGADHEQWETTTPDEVYDTDEGGFYDALEGAKR